MIQTESEPLTREQLKNLRKSGRVHFWSSPKGAQITTTVATGERDGEGRAKEISYVIPVASLVRAMNEREGETPIREVAYCSYMLHSDNGGENARYWRTITSLLKRGDRLELAWGRDYESNGNTKRANLHVDRLTLHVHRGDKKLTFIIPTPVCANDTARTVRRGPYNME